jgi:hypothetical protein
MRRSILFLSCLSALLALGTHWARSTDGRRPHQRRDSASSRRFTKAYSHGARQELEQYPWLLKSPKGSRFYLLVHTAVHDALVAGSMVLGRRRSAINADR